MRVERLWLTDFRNYRSAEIGLAPGLTVVTGANGQGKTNLLEAVGFLALVESFRGAPTEALVRHGAASAVLRAEGRRGDRALLVEIELRREGRNRVQLNRQPLRRARDLLGTVAVTVFAPDDLELVKGGPAGRRAFLDAVVVACRPSQDRLRADLDKVLRQRNALLRQAAGRLSDDVALTLDVWDAKLSEVGEQLATARATALEHLAPRVGAHYRALSGSDVEVRLAYDAPWREEGLAEALSAARRDDLRRGVSTVGPHRDDVQVYLAGLPARTHASQGEQRSLALAFRLAEHTLVEAETGAPPLLLLDDVFSELDAGRSAALLAELPDAQTLLSTATGVPRGATPECTLIVEAGELAVRDGPG